MKVHFGCLIIAVSSFLIFTSCTREETPKKIRLYNRAGKNTVQNKPQPSTLWFGFELRLGPKEEIRIYTSFLDYLEQATGMRFRIRMNERYADTVENLGNGSTHFAAVDTLSYVIGREKYDIRYLANGVNRDGDPSYRVAIFTRPDRVIGAVRELKGKCFAFGAKISAQGHLIPRKMLADAGITLNELGDYMYTGSNMNVVKAILNGDCDAGAIHASVAGRLEARGQIRVMTISEPYPSSVIAYHGSIDKGIVEEVRGALLALEPAGQHGDMLVDWEKTEMPLGFTSIKETVFDRIGVLAERYGLFDE